MSPPPNEQAGALPAPSCVLPPEPGPLSDFGSFYRATVAPLREYLSRVLGDRAEAQDIAQDAYVRTFEAMQGRVVNLPRSYLFATARRLALNFRMRRGGRMRPAAAPFLESRAGVAADPAQLTMEDQNRRSYAAAVLKLPAACREILILRLHEGLPPSQIAARLGLSESTVSNQLTRALREVRTYVASQNEPIRK